MCVMAKSNHRQWVKGSATHLQKNCGGLEKDIKLIVTQNDKSSCKTMNLLVHSITMFD